MSSYDKSDIFKGTFLIKDGGPCIEAPRPVRYGDPPPDYFSEVSTNLDQVKARIDKLRGDLRAARVRK